MKSTLNLGLLLAVLGSAATATADGGRPPGPGMLPLEEGNYWRYKCTDCPTPLMSELRVAFNRPRGKDRVFTLDGFKFGISEGPIAFAEHDGGLHEYYADQLYMFYPWQDISQPVEIPPLADDCMHGSSGHFDHAAPITVPVGDFEFGLSIDYSSRPCENSGLVRETFVFGVGLVERQVLTANGIQTWVLVHARVGGMVLETSPGYERDDADGSNPRVSESPIEQVTWSTVKSRFH